MAPRDHPRATGSREAFLLYRSGRLGLILLREAQIMSPSAGYVAGVLSSTSSTSPRYSDTRRAASPEPMEHRRARGPGRAPLEPGLTTRVPALHGCRCSRRTTQRLATSVSKSAVAQIPLSFHSYFTPPDPSSSTQPPSCVNTPEPSMYSSSGFNSLHRARDSPTMF